MTRRHGPRIVSRAVRALLLATSVAFAAPPLGLIAQSAAPGTSLVGSPGLAASVAPRAEPIPSGVPVELEFADGPFDLLDPAVGLADLTSYVATLSVTFDGTVEGSPVNATSSASMRVTPVGSDLTIDRGSNGPTSYRADVAGISYATEGDGACTAVPTAEGESLADLDEPASQLHALVGADEAGSETVNDLPTRHYTFDERALGPINVTTASGEVWVADPGGYVVRYRLSLDAGPAYLGEGTSGTRTVDYDLTDPNGSVAIELPEDCPAQSDVPVPPDATDVVRLPGIVSFQSTMSLKQAAKFYTTQLRSLGWKADKLLGVAAPVTTAMLGFTKGEGALTIVMHDRSGSIDVRIVETP